jgi:hypothetical protein
MAGSALRISRVQMQHPLRGVRGDHLGNEAAMTHCRILFEA